MNLLSMMRLAGRGLSAEEFRNTFGVRRFDINWSYSDPLLLAARYGATDQQDSVIMAELAEGSRYIGRATLCPVTLATIGLPACEYRAIARSNRLDREARSLAALSMRHAVLCAFKARPADIVDLEYCPHGLTYGDDAMRPHNCEECNADHGASVAEASIGH